MPWRAGVRNAQVAGSVVRADPRALYTKALSAYLSLGSIGCKLVTDAHRGTSPGMHVCTFSRAPAYSQICLHLLDGKIDRQTPSSTHAPADVQ
eukprot:6200814-Pleurochrysis_carterae.AAC.1